MMLEVLIKLDVSEGPLLHLNPVNVLSSTVLFATLMKCFLWQFDTCIYIYREREF